METVERGFGGGSGLWKVLPGFCGEILCLIWKTLGLAPQTPAYAFMASGSLAVSPAGSVGCWTRPTGTQQPLRIQQGLRAPAPRQRGKAPLDSHTSFRCCYRSRIFFMMSSTVSFVWGSRFNFASICRMAYTIVEWSRPPKVSPISTIDICVISRTI